MLGRKLMPVDCSRHYTWSCDRCQSLNVILVDGRDLHVSSSRWRWYKTGPSVAVISFCTYGLKPPTWIEFIIGATVKLAWCDQHPYKWSCLTLDLRSSCIQMGALGHNTYRRPHKEKIHNHLLLREKVGQVHSFWKFLQVNGMRNESVITNAQKT